MKELRQKEIRSIQCEVMQNVHDFMMENNLKYSLACGTLIGVIRHKGYIPWDDDIDIYMPREDYQRLIRLFPETYREHYKLASFERCPGWCRAYANIYDDRTIWEEEKTDKEMTVGINIDIFPVDSVPDDINELKKHINKRKFLTSLWVAKYTTIRWSYRPFVKNIVIILLKVLLLPFSINRIVKYIDSYIQNYNHSSSKRLFGILGGVIEKQPFLKEDFEEVLLLPFESHEFCVMKGYDDCLRNGYGDYMKLPPLEKRKSHHYFKAYLKD